MIHKRTAARLIVVAALAAANATASPTDTTNVSLVVADQVPGGSTNPLDIAPDWIPYYTAVH
jgi:hypothetical protein